MTFGTTGGFRKTRFARKPGLSVRLASALAALVVWSIAPPASASALNEALLRAERVGPTYEANVAAVDRAVERIRRDGTGAEALTTEADRLKAAAKRSFSVDEALGAVDKALKAVEGVADEAPATKALERLAALEEQAGGLDEDAWAKTVEQTKAAWEKRDDRDAIIELSNLMAQPELAGETAVTALRMHRVLSAVLDRGRDRMASLDDAARMSEIAAMLEQTRSEDDPDPALSRTYFKAYSRSTLTVFLSQLSADDVAALASFYKSASGRARRTAIVDAFTRSTDSAARAAVTDYLGGKP